MKSINQVNKLSVLKTILYIIACIAIYIVIEVIGVLLTEWISNPVIKVIIRELFIRTPLTIISLHFFAKKVIRTYDPNIIYCRPTFKGIMVWTGIGIALPVSIYLFYYLAHLMIPMSHTIALSSSEKLEIAIKCITISIAAGLNEEILFRGHLYYILKERCSPIMAIFFSALTFGLVHIFMLPKFTISDALLVVVGGIINGSMLSGVYRYTKVIWYAVIVHAVWDIFFIGKITLITDLQSYANQAIIALKITSDKVIFTGAGFGLEAALPSLGVIIILAAGIYFSSIRRRRLAQ
ncbi:MAG TPA: CPBP family intramembrane glutamic endopeptidase [Mucilaginibacter sp.]